MARMAAYFWGSAVALESCDWAETIAGRTGTTHSGRQPECFAAAGQLGNGCSEAPRGVSHEKRETSGGSDCRVKEVRIHGRGGQGSVVMAELVARAAFEDGKEAQAFPYLGGGGERRGAPVQAFVRIGDQPIRLRCKVHHPGYVIVQDATLAEVVDLREGLLKGAIVIVNTEQPAESFPWAAGLQVYTVPASRIAMEVFGRPLVNSAMMGAFAATGEVSLEGVRTAWRERFPGKVGEQNIKAAEMAYVHLREATAAPASKQERAQ